MGFRLRQDFGGRVGGTGKVYESENDGCGGGVRRKGFFFLLLTPHFFPCFGQACGKK